MLINNWLLDCLIFELYFPVSTKSVYTVFIWVINKILVDATATVTHWIFITEVVITKYLSAKYDIHIKLFSVCSYLSFSTG